MKLLTALVPAILLAQSDITRLVDLRSMETSRLDHFLSMYGVRVTLDPTGRYGALRGTPEQIAAAEEAIKRVQVPSRNIDLELQVVLGTASAPGQLPASLEAVMKPYRAGFGGFRSLDSVTLRVRERSKGELNSLIPEERTRPGSLLVAFSDIGVSPDTKGSAIRIDNLRFGFRYPVATAESPSGPPPFQMLDASLKTELDLREGQKVLAGRLNLEGRSGSALFVILTARVVD